MASIVSISHIKEIDEKTVIKNLTNFTEELVNDANNEVDEISNKSTVYLII